MSTPFRSPVVVDGTLTPEKLEELLRHGTEFAELDYKSTIDLTTKEGEVELAKDVGAMQVLGGYIVGGVDGKGQPTGAMDNVDPRAFDEANLTPKMRKYLPDSTELRTNVIERDSHTIVLIYVPPNPAGAAVFRADGQYEKKGKPVVRFRVSQIFWRDGTRSVPLNQNGLLRLRALIAERDKRDWIAEQQEIRREEREAIRAAYESQQTARAPLGAVNLDLESSRLSMAALELVRAHDEIPLKQLSVEAVARARALIAADEIEAGLADLLDKLTCLAATFLVYGQTVWFETVVATFSEIFTLGFGDEPDSKRFGYSTYIDPREKGPRVWLAVIERVYLLGALAVRREDWNAVRHLTLQRPKKVDEYYGNWLRYALTMSSRAQHLTDREDGHEIKLSLLRRSMAAAEALSCARPDGVDDDTALTSLTQFDFLSNVVAIDGARLADDRVFYPNFAGFNQERIQPIADRLVDDIPMRETIFYRDNPFLAVALQEIARVAHQVGVPFGGFWGWERTPVQAFIAEHAPQSS